MGDVSTRSIVNSWASSPARRRNMQANRSRDTKPELEVRRALHRLGLRYRVAIAPEPGLPRRADIVFTRARVAVFIDGCFWHGCPEHGRSTFNHNAECWPAKIAANVARDADTNARLYAAGWHVLRYWEHEDAEDVVEEIRRTLLAVRSSLK
ncbi:MAG: very short patch repair endonuclease [Propioniciclava sp.]